MNYKKNYMEVQFIGHVLSTTPDLKVSVEGMSDWGVYLGDEDDIQDIGSRLEIVNTVIKQALANDKINMSDTVLKVFTFPEFFWRGIKGAYYYPEKDSDKMYDQICKVLSGILNDIGSKYDLSDWLFLFGSILTTNDITNCTTENDLTLSRVGDDFLSVYNILDPVPDSDKKLHVSRLMKIIDKKITAENSTDEKLSNLLSDILDMSDLLAEKEVYNRCFIYYSGQQYSIQKENKSKEDFILNNPSETADEVEYYLQTMVGYPSINSDNNPVKTLPYSTFNCGNLNIGVEICLDHSRKRLLGYVSDNKISPLDVQIIISCGMQLKKDSAATKEGGVLFNCDGEYVLKGDAQNGDHCHSQLKTYSFTASCGPLLSTFIPAKEVLKVDILESETKFYPHGLGEIHIYDPIQKPAVNNV